MNNNDTIKLFNLKDIFLNQDYKQLIFSIQLMYENFVLIIISNTQY